MTCACPPGNANVSPTIYSWPPGTQGKTVKAFASHPNEISLSSFWWGMEIWEIWKPLECFLVSGNATCLVLFDLCWIWIHFVLPPPLRTEYKPTLFTVFHIRVTLHMLLQKHAWSLIVRPGTACRVLSRKPVGSRQLIWSWFGRSISQSSIGIHFSLSPTECRHFWALLECCGHAAKTIHPVSRRMLVAQPASVTNPAGVDLEAGC